MRFKVDENLPDSVILEHTRADDRILLTLDKGIANLLRYPNARHCGVVLFRPGFSGRGSVLAFVRAHLTTLLALELVGHTSVVTSTGIRTR